MASVYAKSNLGIWARPRTPQQPKVILFSIVNLVIIIHGKYLQKYLIIIKNQCSFILKVNLESQLALYQSLIQVFCCCYLYKRHILGYWQIIKNRFFDLKAYNKLLNIIRNLKCHLFSEIRNPYHMNSRQMTEATRSQSYRHQVDNVSDDSFSDEEAYPQNQPSGFEGRNKIYQLTSQVNALSIQKQQLIISYQNALNQERRRSHEVNNINDKLTSKVKAFNEQNQRLRDTLDQVASQNENLTREIEILKEQLESLMSENRRTAEFHHSGDYDHLQIIRDLTIKDQTIKKLQDELQSARRFKQETSDFSMSKENQKQLSMLKQENSELLRRIQTNKKRQIDIKREYQSMLQSKEDIIKKIATQSDEHSKNISLSKDKAITQLKKQIQQTKLSLQDKKIELQNVTQKFYTMEREINKMKRQFKKKEEDMLHQQQVDKQEIAKTYSQKIKNYLKEKEQKIQSLQIGKYEAQTQIGNLKTEINRLKNQISSTSQLNSYLENVNKENDFVKKKLQQTINEKDEQISEMRQNAFNDSSEMKKVVNQYKKQMEEVNVRHQQQLSEKNVQIQKLQRLNRKMAQSESQNAEQQINQYRRGLDKLKGENEELRGSLKRLTQKYEEKNEKMNMLETNIKKQYEERINALQEQVMRANNQKHNVEKSMVANTNQAHLKQQCERLKMINQLSEMQKDQKTEQCAKLKEKVNQMEQNISKLEKQKLNAEKDYKDRNEDYRLLEHAYQQLQEKYKEGVKDLQNKIQEMNDLLSNEKKKHDRKKNEYKANQEKLLGQVKKLKLANQELEDDMENLRHGKGEDVSEMQEKIQRLAHEISIINRERQTMAKVNEEMMKKKVRSFEDEREKMLEYIGQLQQKCNLLTSKLTALEEQIGHLANPDETQQLKQENYNLKLQLSESLKQINNLLQKYKDTEDKFKEAMNRQQLVSDKFNALHQRYRQACKEKNKVIAQLDTSYQQIQKLNAVLRDKEKQISVSRANSMSMHVPKIVPERDVSPNNSYWRKSDINSFTNNSRPIVSPQQVSMAATKAYYNNPSKPENSYIKKEMKKYY